MPSNDAELERLGATCRAFREKRGLKVGEASNPLGISYSHLSNIEAGRRPLTPVLLAKMAQLYGVPEIAIARPDLFPAEPTAPPQQEPARHEATAATT